jgi:hypothetical protein
VFSDKPTRHNQHCELLGLVRVVISRSGAFSLSQVLLVFGEVTEVSLSQEVYYDSGVLAAVLNRVDVRLLNSSS